MTWPLYRDLHVSCGIYQLKQTESYTREHMTGEYRIDVHKKVDGLVHVRIQGRHVNAKTYYLWVFPRGGEVGKVSSVSQACRKRRLNGAVSRNNRIMVA